MSIANRKATAVHGHSIAVTREIARDRDGILEAVLEDGRTSEDEMDFFRAVARAIGKAARLERALERNARARNRHMNFAELDDEIPF